MRQAYFYSMMALMLISQCESEDPINLPPRPFQVSVTFAGKTNASIAWPEVIDPENDSLVVDIYLDNELKASDIKEHQFAFDQLTMEKLYSGEVVVKDSKGNQTSDSFSFQTSPVRTFTGNITLNNQKDVDEFTSHCYTIIKGNLTIGLATPTDIDDLGNFICLNQVTGDLAIYNTPRLTNVDGFKNLEEVGNNFHLSGLDALETLDIPNLRQVGGGILIAGPSNVSGFQSLKKIGSYLGVQGSRTIKISGFDMLEQVGEIAISNNNELVSVEGFGNLTNIERIRILECPKLSALTAFQNIETLEHGLELYLLGLTEMTTFLKLRTVAWLYFSANQNFEKLHYFPELTYAGGLRIDTNNKLHTIRFEKLNALDWLSIADNPILVSADLGILNTAFSVNIQNNDALTNLDFLQPLTEGSFYVQDNNSLIDFCGLANASGAGSLSSSGNAYNPTMINIANGNCHL